jgi:hypothetical protein
MPAQHLARPACHIPTHPLSPSFLFSFSPYDPYRAPPAHLPSQPKRHHRPTLPFPSLPVTDRRAPPIGGVSYLPPLPTPHLAVDRGASRAPSPSHRAGHSMRTRTPTRRLGPSPPATAGPTEAPPSFNGRHRNPPPLRRLLSPSLPYKRAGTTPCPPRTSSELFLPLPGLAALPHRKGQAGAPPTPRSPSLACLPPVQAPW